MIRDRKRRSLKALVSARRWASYAVAGAATTLASGEDVRADIVYSGLLNADLRTVELQLQSGEQIAAGGEFSTGTYASFLSFRQVQGTWLVGSTHARFALGSRDTGISTWRYPWLANLKASVEISAISTSERTAIVRGIYSGAFRTYRYGGVYTHTWERTIGDFGSGFAAMRFDVGHGTQYAWLRIHESTLIDWAYGTPGQALLTGQTAVPESGSLGLLALGAAGLLAWRAARRSVSSH